MPCKIVIDANILFQDWHLDGPAFKVLARYISLGRAELVIPEIVLLETVNNYRREIAKHCVSVRKLNRLLGEGCDALAAPDPDRESARYREALQRKLETLGTQIPSHEDVPHSTLVERALAVRRPFRDSDKGYRDSLLWEVILRKIAERKETTFLISENHRDFGGEPRDGRLHPDLRADLAAAGLPEGCVKLCPSVRDFIHEVIAADPHVAIDEVTESLRDGTYNGFDLLTWFTENCSALAAKCNTRMMAGLGLMPELESPEVTNIDPPGPDGIEVDDVVRIDDRRVVLHATAEVDVTIDGYLFKGDYYGLEESCPLEIMDHDWNEHYMWAQLPVTLPLRFSVTLNVETNEVEGYEADDFGEIFGWCHHCGRPILSDAAEACYHCGRKFF